MFPPDWHKRGCVAGRGVLIDYLSWAESQGIEYDPWTKHCITVEDLEGFVDLGSSFCCSGGRRGRIRGMACQPVMA